MRDFIEIEEFANLHEEWFRKYLMLTHGIPSHDTLERVIANLNLCSWIDISNFCNLK